MDEALGGALEKNFEDVNASLTIRLGNEVGNRMTNDFKNEFQIGICLILPGFK